jgi:ribosomal protein S18 acetylase RimI-like enzyme
VSCALELLAGALDQPEGNTYESRVVVDDQDHPLAYACFGLCAMTDATYDLYWLITDAAHRGRGLGAILMTDVEDLLRARGARNVRVETSSLEGQGGARRFYLRVGYQEVGRIVDFYRPGDDLITLNKRLSP